MKKQAASSYFDYSKELLAVLNAQGEFIEVNSAWKDWIGSNSENLEEHSQGIRLVGSVFNERIASSDHGIIAEAFLQTQVKGQRFEGELRVLTSENSGEVAASFSLVAVDDQGTRVFVARELSPEKQEIKLLDVGEHLAHLGTWEYDLLMRKLTWSDETYRIHDTERDLFEPSINMSVQFCLPEFRANYHQALNQLLIFGTPFSLEIELKTKRNRIIWAKTIAEAELSSDENPRVLRVFGTIQDITKDKELQMEAREAALAGVKARSAFLANMSHELRTPMNAIMGMADLLGETTLDSEQRGYLSTLDKAAHGLLGIMNDVLELSQLESGKVLLEWQSFGLHDLIETICIQHSFVAHQKGLEFILQIDPHVPEFISGDPRRIQQVVSKLVGNAIKFTDSGEVFVQVKNTTASSEFTEVEFLIEDTGIGIGNEIRQAIFESFSLIDQSSTRKYGGAGLGLSISKRLIELMGGRIWLDSEEGKGSKFHFNMHLRCDDKENTVQKNSPFSLSLLGLRALIIDNHARHAQVLAEKLELYGTKVQIATELNESLQLLAEFHQKKTAFDIILVQPSGLEVLKRAKDRGLLPVASILILDSQDRIGDLHRYHEYGVVGSMVKPFRDREVTEALHAALRAVQSRTTTVVATPASEAIEGEIRKLKILLVDDHEDNRLLILNYLKKTHHDVEIAENGEIAFWIFKESAFDLVLMDIQMPVMDGYTATRQMREWELKTERPRTPIVALSAYSLKDEMEKSIAAGCDHHLTKPIKKADFLAFITALQDQGFEGIALWRKVA